MNEWSCLTQLLQNKIMNNNDPDLTPHAQKLRKEMTKEETRLWYGYLRKLPFGFRRQKVIGKYIVDFYCPSKKTVIELDGSQHYKREGVVRDMERDAYLASRRIKVLRYSNFELNTNFYGVCNDIYCRLTGKILEPQNLQRDWILEYEEPELK